MPEAVRICESLKSLPLAKLHDIEDRPVENKTPANEVLYLDFSNDEVSKEPQEVNTTEQTQPLTIDYRVFFHKISAFLRLHF